MCPLKGTAVQDFEEPLSVYYFYGSTDNQPSLFEWHAFNMLCLAVLIALSTFPLDTGIPDLKFHVENPNLMQTP